MELGALVCTARAPRCADCPVADLCAWQLAGRPAYEGPARKGQAWEGTDRQLRGRLLDGAARAAPTRCRERRWRRCQRQRDPARALPRLAGRRRAGRATGRRPLPAARLAARRADVSVPPSDQPEPRSGATSHDRPPPCDADAAVGGRHGATGTDHRRGGPPSAAARRRPHRSGGRAGHPRRSRLAGRGSRAGARRARAYTHSAGAGESGLARLVELHFVNLMGDAALTVAWPARSSPSPPTRRAARSPSSSP